VSGEPGSNDPVLTEACIQRPDEAAEYFSEERCHILELSNGPGDSAASVARARVAPDTTTAWHRVRGTVERYVILEGTGRVEVGAALVELVQPGDVVVIPADEPQRITNTGDSVLSFLCICTPRFTWSNYQRLE
jgi:mannose-6-phosphate isomerase-like protein (cupin superfamily)